jgi:hypothetical protein
MILMKNDLGIVCINLENSETSSVIMDTARSFIKNNPYNQVCIFNSYSDIIGNNSVPILHISQAKFFNGNLIVFDIPSLILSKNFINLSKRFYYAHDIPWAHNIMSFDYWSDIFESTDLEVITQNQKLYDIYEICWKKPIGISEDFSYETIKNLL